MRARLQLLNTPTKPGRQLPSVTVEERTYHVHLMDATTFDVSGADPAAPPVRVTISPDQALTCTVCNTTSCDHARAARFALR